MKRKGVTILLVAAVGGLAGAGAAVGDHLGSMLGVRTAPVKSRTGEPWA